MWPRKKYGHVHIVKPSSDEVGEKKKRIRLDKEDLTLILTQFFVR